MESIIADAIIAHLEYNCLLHANQHGFRRQRSCLTNLLCARDQWTKTIDDGHSNHIVYLDFSKAFDRVDHSILLAKLHSCGIRGNLLMWLSSYLQQRTFCVSVHGTRSCDALATSGVPQGSILGPLLFNVFINDLIGSLKSPGVFYADDGKIWRAVTSTEDIQLLQSDLQIVSNWANTNNLPLNLTKSKVVASSNSNCYSIGSNILQNVNYERDLGVITESTMSVSKQCIAANKKAMRILGLLRRTLGLFEPSILPILLSCYIRPQVEYSIQAWSPWLIRDERLLEAAQRWATKLTRGMWYKSYEERLSELGLFSLKYRRIRGDLILTYKILHTKDHPCRHLLQRPTTSHLRGHPLKLLHSFSRVNCRRNFFSLRVVTRWNSLPQMIVEADNLEQFKRMLDSHLVDFHYQYP